MFAQILEGCTRVPSHTGSSTNLRLHIVIIQAYHILVNKTHIMYLSMSGQTAILMKATSQLYKTDLFCQPQIGNPYNPNRRLSHRCYPTL